MRKHTMSRLGQTHKQAGAMLPRSSDGSQRRLHGAPGTSDSNLRSQIEATQSAQGPRIRICGPKWRLHAAPKDLGFESAVPNRSYTERPSTSDSNLQSQMEATCGTQGHQREQQLQMTGADPKPNIISSGPYLKLLCRFRRGPRIRVCGPRGRV